MSSEVHWCNHSKKLSHSNKGEADDMKINEMHYKVVVYYLCTLKFLIREHFHSPLTQTMLSKFALLICCIYK